MGRGDVATHPRFVNGPVIVAGAGAVGLTIAVHLHRAGIPVVVVEQRPEPAERGRSSTLQPWALAMFGELELLGPMLEAGQVVDQVAWFDLDTGGALTLSYDLVADEVPHPFRLNIDQRFFNGLLEAALPMGSVHWGRRVSWIDQTADGVVVQLDDRTRMHGSWVIGADGIASSVRDVARISAEISDQTDVFGSLTLDGTIHPQTPTDAGSLCFHTATSWTLAHRLVDGFRVLFRIPENQPNQRIFDDAWLQERLAGVVGPLDFDRVRHRAAYTVQHRLASSFRSGRILLAGDAAHVTFPADGAALNMGLRDAQLLSAALRSETSELLDAYGEQRPAELRPWVLSTGSRPGVWNPNDGFPFVQDDIAAQKALLLGESLATLL